MDATSTTFDWKTLDRLSFDELAQLFEAMFDRAIAADLVRIERQQRLAAERLAALAPAPTRAAIKLSVKKRVARGSWATVAAYVSSVSYRDGDGYKVSKFGFTENAEKALTFTKTAASGVAEYLVRCGYSLSFEVRS